MLPCRLLKSELCGSRLNECWKAFIVKTPCEAVSAMLSFCPRRACTYANQSRVPSKLNTQKQDSKTIQAACANAGTYKHASKGRDSRERVGPAVLLDVAPYGRQVKLRHDVQLCESAST